ncbi:MAG: aminotransferase class V-fold PLP-dependent enzyme [Bauldia sp.]|nr:aminotransferase class V-fold PLP-dependent enzyme [Bauldia sp.]
MSVYARRGIPTIINAAGTLTRLSGGVIRPEVAQAMAEASALAVDMTLLQAHAAGVIAGLTGAESGYVTSGASAGLLIGTAACVTGLDPAAMARLPDTATLKNEVVVSRSQRNGYDHAVRTAGVALVEVGLPDRASGAGIRDAEPWEYAAAINEKTAAVLYVATRDSRPQLSEVAAVAHAAGVPVIVDAAAEIPPQANLRRFIAEGADLVAFSGGKAIGGPQASGILCGRRDLIAAAALQQLDMDVVTELWDPPAQFIDRSRLGGLPRHGIGRPCKAGKEEIIGLLTALELFVAEGDAARHARWLADIRVIAAGLADIAAETIVTGEDDPGSVPKAELRFPRGREARALALLRALVANDPAIHADAGDHAAGIVRFNPIALRAGQAEAVAEAARAFSAAGG